MRNIFSNVSLEVIEKFSPELMLGIEACLEEGHDNLTGILASNSRASIAIPSALVIGTLEGKYMAGSRESLGSLTTDVPENFGSLAAYAMAHAGDIKALNMLEVITALPNLTQWREPVRHISNENSITRCSRFAMAACRFALSKEQGLKAIKDYHSSYFGLLGIDSNGNQSFAISDNQSQYAVDQLVHEDLKFRILSETKKRSPLSIIDILSYSGPLLVALTITQPQIWIEQGHDPQAVKDIIDRRVRGFWGMSKLTHDVIDELVQTAIEAAFMPFPGLIQGKPESLWGITMEACKKAGPAKTLDSAKYSPVVTAGPMALFKPAKGRSMGQAADAFQFIGQPEYANRMLGKPWQDAITRDTANRVGIWVLGKHKDVWPLTSSPVFRQGMVDWHLKSDSRSPKHPLTPVYLHWHEFLQGTEWEEMFTRKVLSKPDADHTWVFMREFSATEPERFDALAYGVLSDQRRKTAHKALMPHVSSTMRSMALVSDIHRDRAFGADLGL